MTNLKFWHYINGAFVKLKIKPGQTLNHGQYTETDEGYTASGETFTLSSDGRTLELAATTNARDCDGQTSTYTDLICDAREMLTNDEGNPRPDWQLANQTQRDYTAERAGY